MTPPTPKVNWPLIVFLLLIPPIASSLVLWFLSSPYLHVVNPAWIIFGLGLLHLICPIIAGLIFQDIPGGRLGVGILMSFVFGALSLFLSFFVVASACTSLMRF